MSEIKRLYIRVHPNCNPPRVEERNEIFHVYVSSSPEKEKANKELIIVLSRYLKCEKKSLELKKGHHGKDKVIFWTTD